MTVSAEGRVENQKLNQTAALQSFGWVFGFQLDLLEKKLVHSPGSYLYLLSAIFIPRRIYIYPQRRDHLQMVPYGVPIWSLSVLFSPNGTFFWFQFRDGNRPFLTRKIFYCDGRMVDGGGGWVPKRFFDFAQNFFRWSSQHINLPYFGKSAKNFFYRKKIRLQVSKSGVFLVKKYSLYSLRLCS